MRSLILRCVVFFFACILSLAQCGAQEEYGVKQRTDDPALDGFPVWSPDGRYILFPRFGGNSATEKTGL